MLATSSPRNSSIHRLASPFIASVLENLLPSSSRQTNGLASVTELNVLPNQLSRFMNPLALCPVSNSPPFHSPSMNSIVAGCSAAQKSSSSASEIVSVRSFSSVNVLRANSSATVLSDPLAGERHKRVVLVGCGDGDAHPVLTVRTHDDPGVGGRRNER